jgi:hypothetical protein
MGDVAARAGELPELRVNTKAAITLTAGGNVLYLSQLAGL